MRVTKLVLLRRMFDRVRNEDGELMVTLVRDHSRRVYHPAFNFSNIPFWDLQHGLWVKVEDAIEVIWEGERIAADAEITIERNGYYLIPYYPMYQLNAHNEEFYVISGIDGEVVSVTDDQGRFMIPEYNFSNMNPWQPGKSYLLHIHLERGEINFSYPEERDEELVTFESGDHWEIPIRSSDSTPLLISNIDGPNGFEPAEGDQIAAFTEDGDLTGFGDVHERTCGVIIWRGGNGDDDNQFVQLDERVTLHYWDEDQEAEYEINVTEVIFGDGLRIERIHSVIEVFVDAGEFEDEIEVQLNSGWNMMSINVEPPEDMWINEQGPDIELMTEQLRIDEDNHHLTLMKNDQGQFYSPEHDFNSIPFWNLEEGYLVRVDEDVMGVWTGVRIAPDADINLEGGWNLIAYYPTFELDASSPNFHVLSPILDNVQIAKDVEGRFMNPEFEFSNMPPWRETQGYMVRVDEDVVLNYPPQQEEEENVPREERDLGNSLTPTGSNLSLLVLGLESRSGEIMRAIDLNNVVVGQGIIDADGRCGLAVWGDDHTTSEKDGLGDGEAFTLMINEEVVEPSVYHAGKKLAYMTDDFIVLDATVQALIPTEYYVSTAYPNPFNERTVLRYGLPESGLVKMDLFDISGRHIRSLGSFEKPAGSHSLELNAVDLGSGVFLVSIRTNKFS